MSGTSQHLRKPAMLAALIAVVGLGAASAMAALTVASGPKPFELVWSGSPEAPESFTSSAPFCESGSAVDMDFGLRRFACADGSGSITLDIGYPQALFDDRDWSILEGTGQYADLRGRGTSHWSENWDDWSFSTTFKGVVDADAVAPTIALANLKASKVAGKKGVYTIAAALDFRDNVEDNPVSYIVSVRRESGAGPWLASKSGEGLGGISFELRVRRPNARVGAVLIWTTAVDPVGNESTLDAWVKLPK